ncbi:hypothetical protein [Frankia sp. AgKG'84/4]
MTPTADGGAVGDAGRRPLTPGPLAVEAALLVDALRGLGGAAAPGRRVWETIVDVAFATTAATAGGSPPASERSGEASAPPAGDGRPADAAGEDRAPGEPARACSCHDRPPTACAVCPVCRLVAAFVGEGPDVIRHLTAAGESLAAALRAIVDTVASAVADAGSADPRPPTAARPGAGREAHPDPRRGEAAGTRPAPAPRPRVQRIDIT